MRKLEIFSGREAQFSRGPCDSIADKWTLLYVTGSEPGPAPGGQSIPREEWGNFDGSGPKTGGTTCGVGRGQGPRDSGSECSAARHCSFSPLHVPDATSGCHGVVVAVLNTLDTHVRRSRGRLREFEEENAVNYTLKNRDRKQRRLKINLLLQKIQPKTLNSTIGKDKGNIRSSCSTQIKSSRDANSRTLHRRALQQIKALPTQTKHTNRQFSERARPLAPSIYSFRPSHSVPCAARMHSTTSAPTDPRGSKFTRHRAIVLANAMMSRARMQRGMALRREMPSSSMRALHWVGTTGQGSAGTVGF